MRHAISGDGGTERSMRNVRTCLGCTLILAQALIFGTAWEQARAAEPRMVHSQPHGSDRWLPGLWVKANPNRNLVWSVPLTIQGTSLADVGDGLQDEAFRAAAKAIANAQPHAIIRLGWEMNGRATAWFAGGQEADYIRAFRRVVEIFRQYSGEFRFDWCVSWGPQDSDADKS